MEILQAKIMAREREVEEFNKKITQEALRKSEIATFRIILEILLAQLLIYNTEIKGLKRTRSILKPKTDHL